MTRGVLPPVSHPRLEAFFGVEAKTLSVVLLLNPTAPSSFHPTLHWPALPYCTLLLLLLALFPTPLHTTDLHNLTYSHQFLILFRTVDLQKGRKKISFNHQLSIQSLYHCINTPYPVLYLSSLHSWH